MAKTKPTAPAATESIEAKRGRLRAYALSFPGAFEDFPWGETVAKVGKKVFIFMGSGTDSSVLGFSVKLPMSGTEVLELPFAKPTGYGLGKSGWVSVHLTKDEVMPFEVLCAWVEESYRAIAPKKLVKELDARSSK